MSIPTWAPKAPNERLDYALDWSARLPDGDTIVNSTWSVPNGLTQTSNLYQGKISVIWLEGGTDGETYTLTNTITSQEGRVLQQTVRLKVRVR